MRASRLDSLRAGPLSVPGRSRPGGWIRAAAAVAVPLLLAGSAQTNEPDDLVGRLDARLEQQFERWGRTRELLVRRARERHERLDREQWEELIALPEEARFTPDELAALEARQREAIAASRRTARAASLLSLDALRASGEVEAFCRDLPKGAMLHLHPNGTLDADTIQRLLDRVNPRIDPRTLLAPVEESLRELARAELFFLEPYGGAVRYAEMSPPDRERTRALFHWPPGTRVPQIAFGMVASLRDDPDFHEIVLRAFFERSRAHRVRYLEMAKSLEPGDSEEILRHSAALADEYDLVVRFNVGLGRGNDEAWNLERVRAWIEAGDHPLVTGIDLYGYEPRASTLAAGQRIYPTVLAAHARGRTRLRTTTHAAGVGEPRNPRDALVLGVERLGHGVGLRADPVALEYARRLRTPVEVNLSSNLRLGYVESLAAHPFLDFHRLGLRVSLSTDDEGMLATTISDECTIAVRDFDLEYAELRRMVLDSIETSFAEDALRDRLARRVESELAAFEKRWSRFRSAPAGAAAQPSGPST